MTQVSYLELQNLTGKTYRTIRRKLNLIAPVRKGKKGAILFDSTVALLEIYKPNKKPGSPTDGGQYDLTTERARLAKEQADGYELKNASSRGELVSIPDVMKTLERVIVTVNRQFLALPDRLAQMLETTADVNERRELIDAEIKVILNALSKGGHNLEGEINKNKED